MRSKKAMYNIGTNIILQLITIAYGFIVPLIIIITTMIALFKVVLSGKKEEMIDTVNVSVKKIIAGLVVFFIPLILSFAIDNLLSKGNIFSEINQCIEKAKTAINGNSV